MKNRFILEDEDVIILQESKNSADLRDIILEENMFIWNGKGGGNPYHADDGKFTFAPYKKYPELKLAAKKLATIKKAEGNLTDKYLAEVDKEREKLYKKYGQDKEEADRELSKWNDGWYMWDEKGNAKINDIDIALSKAILKESGIAPEVYRTQVDSKTPGKMEKAEFASWSPDLKYTADWAKFLAGSDSKIDVFKTKVTQDNLKILPDVLYSGTSLRDKTKYQEHILSNDKPLKAIEKGLTRRELRDKYLNYLPILDKILNTWDESKHPRDSLGRFTFVIGLKSFMTTGRFTKDLVNELHSRIQNYAKISSRTKAQVEGESEDIGYYQGLGYSYINNSLRAGEKPDDGICDYLDAACRFSADTEIYTYRGESSWSNNWKGTKVGQDMPEGLRKSFISTSLNKGIAQEFAEQKRSGDPKGQSTIYETTIQFRVKTSQRFGIPQAYLPEDANGMWESELIFPYGSTGKVTQFSESTRKSQNRTIVEQRVEITLGE